VSRALVGAAGPFADAGAGERLLEALAGEGRLLDLAVEEGFALAWEASSAAAFDPAARTICVMDGQLYDLDALARTLGADGGAGPERVVAAGYERWGTEVLDRLRGRFALVLWDRKRRSGLVAVDALGAGGLFLHEAEGTLRFASELSVLLRALPSRPGPDQTEVARWLARGTLHPGRTLYAGVRRLPGGSYVELTGSGRVRERRYWAPRYSPPTGLSHAEAVEAVREGTEAAVRRRMPAEGPAGVLLSGGLDSSSVAAFAAASGGEVRAYSLFFPGRPSMDESAFVRTVTANLGVPLTALNVSGGSMLAASLEYLRAWQEPSASPNLVLHRPLLDRVAGDGVNVLLDGQGGDELFGCVSSLLADRLRRGRLRSALSLARRLPGVGPAPSRRVLWNVVRRYGLPEAVPGYARGLARTLRGTQSPAPAWLTPSVSSALSDDKLAGGNGDGPRWWAELSASLTTGRERAGAHDFLRHKNALAGLEGAHPYFDDLELVELALGLPPELAFDPELDRPLLRAATAGLVPDAVRLRRSKSYFDELFRETLAGPDLPTLTRLLAAPDAEVNAYVRPEVVREWLLRRAATGGTGDWAWPLWRLATTECWLRSQAEPSFADRLAAEERLAPPEFTVA
jgi:asparagine synthase (glutamine-hydrolysing)